MEEVFAVIGVFGILPLIIFLVLHYKTKARSKNAELIKALIDNDKEVNPEIIKSIGFAPLRRHGDLRFGMILVATALAMILFGGMIPEEDAQRAFAGLAMFPLLIGIAMLIFWYFVSRKDHNGV